MKEINKTSFYSIVWPWKEPSTSSSISELKKQKSKRLVKWLRPIVNNHVEKLEKTDAKSHGASVTTKLMRDLIRPVVSPLMRCKWSISRFWGTFLSCFKYLERHCSSCHFLVHPIILPVDTMPIIILRPSFDHRCSRWNTPTWSRRWGEKCLNLLQVPRSEASKGLGGEITMLCLTGLSRLIWA